MLDGILNSSHSTSVWSEAQPPKARLRGAIGLMHLRRHNPNSQLIDDQWHKLLTHTLTSGIARHTSASRPQHAQAPASPDQG
jgi:hypothetical protein